MDADLRGPVGIVALGRPTFDVAHAGERLAAMLAALDRAGQATIGPRRLLLDAAGAREAVAEIARENPRLVLILQVTFTDAALAVEIARAFDRPLAIWAVPEPRAGGRLRLNAFCGLNLAAHALGLAGRAFGHLYAAPEAPGTAAALTALLSGGGRAAPVEARPAFAGDPRGREAARALHGARIGRIGEHPAGFDTCAYDPERVRALAGAEIEALPLEVLFERARSAPGDAVDRARAVATRDLSGLDGVDRDALERSLRLAAALDAMRGEGRYDAFAIRCWPEAFTEYGGAVCGPVSMTGEAGAPCACEADVYGALSALLLQKVAGAPAFLTDLVDLDRADGTGVVWHCGQAPVSMADPDFDPRATIHSNRRMPLLYEFPLKPGRVTFFRISQARGRVAAVIGGGEMLKRPMAFTGTSGVVRFDTPVPILLDRIMGAALEHHLALAYGDHRDALEAAAGTLGIPVVEL